MTFYRLRHERNMSVILLISLPSCLMIIISRSYKEKRAPFEESCYAPPTPSCMPAFIIDGNSKPKTSTRNVIWHSVYSSC